MERGVTSPILFCFRVKYNRYYEKNTKRIAGTTDMWV